MWQAFADAAPLLLHGLWVTVYYTVCGALAAFVISFVLGLMALSPVTVVRVVSRVVVEFFRGTSLVVQLFWIFYVLPQFGYKLAPLAAATVAFGLNFGAYGSEVVRGAIVSVPKAQWEATVALSLSPFQRMRRVILPQAVPEMIPPFGNLLVQVLKSSSLLFYLAITEFTFEIQELRYNLPSTFQAYVLALIVYFLVAQAFIYGMRFWERRAATRVGRGPVKVRPENIQAVPEKGAAL